MADEHCNEPDRSLRVEHHQRDQQSDGDIFRLCSELAKADSCGVLVTWYGPWSYTFERCGHLPPGMVYERLAPETSDAHQLLR